MPRLISLHISGTVITVRTPLPTWAGFRAHNGNTHLRFWLLYLSKPSPPCPQYLPLVCADPHGSRTFLTENDIELSNDVCNKFALGVGLRRPLASSNKNTANPTFLACQALIARLLLRGNGSSPSVPLHNQPHAWFGGVKLIGHVATELDRINWNVLLATFDQRR